jgi:hypothetical protein
MVAPALFAMNEIDIVVTAKSQSLRETRAGTKGDGAVAPPERGRGPRGECTCSDA